MSHGRSVRDGTVDKVVEMHVVDTLDVRLKKKIIEITGTKKRNKTKKKKKIKSFQIVECIFKKNKNKKQPD